MLQQEIHEARLETIFFREAYEKLAKSNKELPTEIESLKSKCKLHENKSKAYQKEIKSLQKAMKTISNEMQRKI